MSVSLPSGSMATFRVKMPVTVMTRLPVMKTRLRVHSQ